MLIFKDDDFIKLQKYGFKEDEKTWCYYFRRLRRIIISKKQNSKI